MVIAKKPVETANKFNIQNQATIDNIIAKGGEVASTKQPQELSNEKDSIKPIKLLIPHKLVIKVDQLLKNLPIKRTRHNWILEAIYEKHQRETTS